MHLDTESQNHVIAQLYKKIFRFQEFNGADYFQALDEIEWFIAQNELSCDFVSLIDAKEVEPKIFIDYIQVANKTDVFPRNNAPANAYEYYQIKTNPKALDTYLSELLPNNFRHADIVKALRIILHIHLQRFYKQSRIAL